MNSINTLASSNGNGFLANAAFRYGLTDSFEAGAFLEYKTESVTVNSVTSSREGLSNLIVGLRRHILNGKGLAPAVGFQFRLRLPTGNKYYTLDNIAPSFVFVTSQQLKRFTLITNLGGSWNGTSSAPAGTYTINLSCTLTNTFGAFIENYGNIAEGIFETRMDGGVVWLVTPNLQLDLLAGFGQNHGLSDHFVSTGVALENGTATITFRFAVAPPWIIFDSSCAQLQE